MLAPVEWDAAPDGFAIIIWRGDGVHALDTPAIINSRTQASVFCLKLSDNDRRCLIEGNDLFLMVAGQIAPFAMSTNLGEILDTARGL